MVRVEETVPSAEDAEVGEELCSSLRWYFWAKEFECELVGASSVPPEESTAAVRFRC